MGSAVDYVREELRLLRMHLRLSQDDFGRGIGYSGSHVSSVETGGRPPTRDYMLSVDRAHDPAFDAEAGDGRFTRMLRELSKLEQTPAWLREWIELEREAALLRWYEPAFLPGLLQTETYARGTMNNGLLPSGPDRPVGGVPAGSAGHPYPRRAGTAGGDHRCDGAPPAGQSAARHHAGTARTPGQDVRAAARPDTRGARGGGDSTLACRAASSWRPSATARWWHTSITRCARRWSARPMTLLPSSGRGRRSEVKHSRAGSHSS